MQQNLHPFFKTLVAIAGLGLTAWEAVGRTGDPRFPLLVIYVVMMGLVSPQALERLVNRLYPGGEEGPSPMPPQPPQPPSPDSSPLAPPETPSPPTSPEA